VFLDVTDMIDYNMSLLNHHDLANSFFCLDKRDPTIGFQFDATNYCGPTYPESAESPLSGNSADGQNLAQCLILGSHLAYYMRSRLDNERGYTATVGISTSKLLAKLVGNVHKPNNQTTLIPPYSSTAGPDEISNVNRFIDDHEIGKIPGIGFKSAQKIRAYILHREATFEPYTERDEKNQVKVRDVRLSQTMGPPKLLDLLGGPGAPRDIGVRTWGLLNGVDNSEVLEARAVPTQISIEDSYMGLQHLEDVRKQLQLLATSLIKRMRTDLIDEDDVDGGNEDDRPRWIAHPRTLRLSTRRRSPKNADGSRDYSYAHGRISRSGHVPKYIFSLAESAEAVAEKLVNDCLVSMFRKLHPDKAFGELSLINVAVTNMVESAGDDRQSSGRDIGKMFKQQGSIANAAVETNHQDDQMYQGSASGNPSDVAVGTQVDDTTWEESDEEDVPSTQLCDVCGSHIPLFAFRAHALYHAAPD
jgi:DNA polymerase iota